MRRSPSGFTLLEILIVLVIIGLALGLASRAFLPPRRAPLADAQAAVEAARRVAVRRAEAVILTFESDGRWTVEDGARRGRLLEGTFGKLPDVTPLVLHISPLGACTIESVVPE